MSNDVDIAVVGAGGGGLVAGLAVAESGVSVVVLEKLARAGGNTALSTGSVIGAGTRWQAEAGIHDEPERLTTDLLRQSGPHEAEALVRRLAETSADLVEWLVDRHGIDLRLITDYRHVGHSVPRLHAPPSRKGQALVDDLLRACANAGVEVLLNNPAAGLLTTDGVVTGVHVSGTRVAAYDLSCSAVVLAANGYAANRRLVERWAPDIAEADYFGAPGSTGEAIEWAEQLGAGVGNIGAYQGYAAVAYPHGSITSWTTIEKGGAMIDAHGHRFGDESRGYSGFTSDVLGAARPAFVLFDRRIRDSVAQHEEEFRDLIDIGGVREFATAAEVAGYIGCPSTSLTRTLDALGASASGDVADEFGRTDFGLGPLRPPYAVVRSVPGLFHTQGGVQVGPDAEVLRPDGSSIAGLYAVGGVSVGLSGRTGGAGYSSGSGLLSALGLGALAGRAAAARASEGPA